MTNNIEEALIERVARAIAPLIGPQEFDELPKDKRALKAAQRGAALVFDSQDDILEIAKAAVEAMTIPLYDMNDLGEKE